MTETQQLMVEMSASIEAFQRTIAERLIPAMAEFAAALRKFYASWPGMPYTAPSRWDADQMKAAR